MVLHFRALYRTPSETKAMTKKRAERCAKVDVESRKSCTKSQAASEHGGGDFFGLEQLN